MGRLWGVGLVAALLGGCATTRFECVRHGGEPVLKLESEHFTVVSDLPARDALVQARRLERLWDAFAVFFGQAPDTSARVPVLLGRGGSADEFVEDSGGFVTFGLEPVFVSTVARTGGGTEGAWSANAHELVHLVSGFWVPSQPRWIAEGLAQYLGDAEFKKETVIRFGRWQWEGTFPLLPLADLWAWDATAGTPLQDQARYQSAWAWTHYLANRDEARLARLWVELRRRPSAREAFDAVFPAAEQAELLGRVRAYLDQGRFSGWESTSLHNPQLQAPTPVEAWEVHLLRRRVFEALGARARVREESLLAEKVAPQPLPPAVQVARAVDGRSGPERTDALRAHAADAAVMVQLATAPDLSPKERLGWAEKAAAAAPDSPSAQLALATAAAALRDPRGLEAARRSAALAPWSFQARVLEATALSEVARCGEAFEVLAAATSLVGERSSGEEREVGEVRARVERNCRRPR